MTNPKSPPPTHQEARDFFSRKETYEVDYRKAQSPEWKELGRKFLSQEVVALCPYCGSQVIHMVTKYGFRNYLMETTGFGHKNALGSSRISGRPLDHFKSSYETSHCPHYRGGTFTHIFFNHPEESYDPTGFPHPGAWTMEIELPLVNPRDLEEGKGTWVFSRFPIRTWKNRRWQDSHWILFQVGFEKDPEVITDRLGPEEGRILEWDPISNMQIFAYPQDCQITGPLLPGDPHFDIKKYADQGLVYWLEPGPQGPELKTGPGYPFQDLRGIRWPRFLGLQDIKDQWAEVKEGATVGRGIHLVPVEGGTISGKDPDTKAPWELSVNSFQMADTPITNYQWCQIMGEKTHWKGLDYPQDRVSWTQALEFCNRLSLSQGLDPVYDLTQDPPVQDQSKSGYRLPTAAEWEYAARGGLKTHGYKYVSCNITSKWVDYMWTQQNSSLHIHPVAQKLPNELGLYDMAGNVEEWCWDPRPVVPYGQDITPEDYFTRELSRVFMGGGLGLNMKPTAKGSRDPKTPAHGLRVVRTLD